MNAHVVVDRAFFVRVFFNMRARLAEAAAVEINLRRGCGAESVEVVVQFLFVWEQPACCF